jgi:hypothetical protein
MSHTNKKKDAGEKRTTVGTYRNADYLLKTTFAKHNKYVGFFFKLEHFDYICFREVFGRMPFHKIIFSVPKQGIWIYIGHSFL